MKSPLRYQVTRCGCGLTSLVNAFVYLFEREDIPPEVVGYASSVLVDRYLSVAHCEGGTSARAFDFLCGWLDDYAQRTGFSLRCEHLMGDEVSLAQGSRMAQALAQGAAIVCGCCLGSDHYVLLTGFDEAGNVLLFDPYYDTWPLHELDGATVVGVRMADEPFAYNRVVERWVFDEPAGTPYTLATKSTRDATILWHA